MSMREAGLRVTASLGSQAHGPDRAHQELAPEGSGNVPGSVPHDPAWRPHFPARHTHDTHALTPTALSYGLLEVQAP